MTQLTILDRISKYLCDHYKLSAEEVESMLPTFLTTLQSHIHDLENSLDVSETIAIAKAGHKLKGALLNLGLDDSAAIAKCIELEGKADNQAVDYAELVRQLKEQLNEIL
jgi:HPt (histidine-containing phosphotransfer) domain-containing protein